MNWALQGGVVYDPVRHRLEPPQVAPQPEATPAHPGMAGQLHHVLRTARLPQLSPRGYAMALAALAQALSEAGFDLGTTSLRMCGLCADQPEPLTRQDAYCLLRSLHEGGFNPAVGGRTVDALAEALCASAVAACDRAAVAVDATTRLALVQRLRGDDEAAPAATAV